MGAELTAGVAMAGGRRSPIENIDTRHQRQMVAFDIDEYAFVNITFKSLL